MQSIGVRNFSATTTALRQLEAKGQPMDKLVEYFGRLSKWQIAGYAALGAVVVFIVGITIAYVSVRNEGRTQELGMVQFYSSMEARYSQNRAAITDVLGVARAKTEAQIQVLQAAIESRKYVTKDGGIDQKALISAVQEAYPDLRGLNVFDRVFVLIEAMREGFAEDQSELADRVRSYNSWRKTEGLFHPLFVRWAGFPSDTLEIHIGDTALKGPAALYLLSTVIMTTDSQRIFKEGRDRQLQFYPNN
jgi:hypothetical protein